MLADEATIRSGLYRLPDEPVGPRVLIPGFRSATSVRGAFGWFTAGWIARLAPGLAEYLSRNDTAPIDFTVAPAFFPEERTAVERAYLSDEEAGERVAQVFGPGRVEASAIGRHALDCLSWMVATGRLRLQVAVPKPESNYHPKIWLFDDGTDQVLARGSGNATVRGVATGVEHLDVDVTWIDHSRRRVRDGIAMLNDWARGHSQGIDRVVSLPEALEQDIIYSAPSRPPAREEYDKAVIEDGHPKWAVDPRETLRARFSAPHRGDRPQLTIPEGLQWKTGPYAHQGEAVEAWESGSDPEHGTISMATGAGKTLTALICATRVQERLAGKALLVVISAPSVPLVVQWREEVRKFGLSAVAPSLEANSNLAVTNLFRSLALGGTHVAVVTNNLLCTPTFQRTVAMKVGNPEEPVQTLLIADEAHTLGAEGFLSNKPEFFERRLALSATPERQFDPDGTEQVFAFFGEPVYEFGLDRAIGFCLVPYNYYVHAATLDGDELERFEVLTGRIGAAMGQGVDHASDTLTTLLIARRRIIETAESKLALLRAVIEQREPRSLQHTLIYASAKNPAQFQEIGAILTELDVRWAPVTEEISSDRRGLDRIFRSFQEGGYQVLLAKKVLDEGIDIPSIREAFIVASSTVQREWIQRRGRVLRRDAEKPWAIVHDFLALPPASMVRSEESTQLKSIIRGELDRAYSFAGHAKNASGKEGVLSDLQRIRSVYWPEGQPQGILQGVGDSALASGTPKGRPW